MKLSELWLREWVNPALSREELCEQLTMSGLEVDALFPVVEEFSHVVVAKVLKVEKHPEADRLQICEVDVGTGDPVAIVCGAKNVKAGMKVPAALDGAVLPGKKSITKTKIRGVTSNGMLCSAVELGIAEQGEGLLPLPAEAPVGESIWNYLKLADFVIDVAITPNRGDCLSVMGMAKEISAITSCQLHVPNLAAVKPSIEDTLSVSVSDTHGCPRYIGRIVRDVQADAVTPMWMQERLRRAGVRCISPVVDVMNYVMLELGQPLHAFDLSKIDSGIQVRKAKSNEELKLLDGQTIQLADDTLIIADSKNPLAIAGIMGGLESAVSLLTKDIFIESAYFTSQAIARSCRRFGLASDSSFRFERGIDPELQRIAVERATELVLEIAGGKPGPVIEKVSPDVLPKANQIHIRQERIQKLLGLTIPDVEIEKIFERLGFSAEKVADGWGVIVPARRSDITLEVDLIEELIRLYGYNKLPLHEVKSGLRIHPRPETTLSLNVIRRALCDLGFNEIISYSFVDKKIQQLLNPEVTLKELVNPMTAEMTVMRSNLWPGLITTFLYNQNRQQARVRLFEIGLRFRIDNGELIQERVLSGLISGSALPEQWGVAQRKVDFFDLKGDLQNIFKLTLDSKRFVFKSATHPALHPGQTADIYRDDVNIGVIGALHPLAIQKLDISDEVFVFEIMVDSVVNAHVPHAQEVSKFPEIRRDVAILVNRAVPSQLIQDTIIDVAGELLKNVNVFDVYQGKGIAQDLKSIALALTLQHDSRTLRDEEVADLVERVIVALKDKFAAELRG